MVAATREENATGITVNNSSQKIVRTFLIIRFNLFSFLIHYTPAAIIHSFIIHAFNYLSMADLITFNVDGK